MSQVTKLKQPCRPGVKNIDLRVASKNKVWKARESWK